MILAPICDLLAVSPDMFYQGDVQRYHIRRVYVQDARVQAYAGHRVQGVSIRIILRYFLDTHKSTNINTYFPVF